MPYVNREQMHKLPKALDLGGVRQDDILVEVGNAAFSGVYTDTTSVLVPTKMNQIVAGFAAAFDSYSPATDANTAKIYALFVEPVVTEDTDSHLKTFKVWRSSQGALSGLKSSYVIYGRHFATD